MQREKVMDFFRGAARTLPRSDPQRPQPPAAGLPPTPPNSRLPRPRSLNASPPDNLKPEIPEPETS